MPDDLMICALTHTRIEEVVSKRLIEKFVDCDDTADGGSVVITLGGEDHVLTREESVQLRDNLTGVLTERQEFLRTACEYREDGTYVIERRHADSSGHRKVFDSFEELRRLFDRLPREFTADVVGRSGLTGACRHLLVRHFVEHPRFECELVNRQPLTVEKSAVDESDESDETPRANSTHIDPSEEVLSAD